MAGRWLVVLGNFLSVPWSSSPLPFFLPSAQPNMTLQLVISQWPEAVCERVCLADFPVQLVDIQLQSYTSEPSRRLVP